MMLTMADMQNTKFARQWAAALRIMQTRKAVLRELAKGPK